MHVSAPGRAAAAPREPAWFTRALEDRPEHLDVEVGGASVHLRCWGPVRAPGVVLVHGGAAHSGWWDHVGPLLAEGRRVVAVDLSGHGDSQTRAAYTHRGWAQEVLAAAQRGGVSGPPVVVGHSMGGWTTATAAVEHSSHVAGVVLIDSLLVDELPTAARLHQTRALRRLYGSREEALARFTTKPAQDLVLEYVERHVAQESLQRDADGWTWKFDPGVSAGDPHMVALLRQVRTPAVLLRCERGLLPTVRVLRAQGALPAHVPVVELADSGHHPMLDHPLQLVGALRALLGMWGVGSS